MNEKELRLELTAMQKELDEANERIEALEEEIEEVRCIIDDIIEAICFLDTWKKNYGEK